RYARKELSLGVELYVYQKDGSLYDQGVATVRDISLGGARICDVALPTGALPITPFTVGIRPMQKPVDDIEIQGQIVRLNANGATSFGVQFGKLDPTAEKKLRRISNG